MEYRKQRDEVHYKVRSKTFKDRNKLCPQLIRDRDNDIAVGTNCAERDTGGWWYSQCGSTHLTGQHTNERTQIKDDRKNRQIFYYHGGDRVRPAESYDSWMEAKMVLVPVGNITQINRLACFLLTPDMQVSVFDVAMRTADPPADPPAPRDFWKLTEGFVAAEGL